jgi:hypothetical protein
VADQDDILAALRKSEQSAHSWCELARERGTDIAALMHYVGHSIGCPHAHMREAKGGHWSSVGGGLPPARIVHACTCGLDDVLRGIDARQAGRIVAPVSETETTGDDDGN